MKEKDRSIRLRRGFNLFRPRVCGYLLASLALFTAAGIGIVLSEKVPLGGYLPAALLALAFLAWRFAVFSPKELLLRDGTVQFSERIYVCRSGVTFVKRGWHQRWVKVEYTVGEIRDVAFRQNPVERLFGVGHITFSGHATYTASRDLEHIPERHRFEIYGIPHFESFRAEFLKRTEQKPSYESE